ncbi:MAG: hypothetical protein CL674_02685 [Bdellovibrionaceae bacterium]|nr:hypothetical protein [Pseudobdellovibrionaceae bacterium]
MLNFLRKTLFCLLGLVVLMAYQNCDFVDGLSVGENGKILESSGGNGDGYGGKLVSYHRHAFGRSCGGNSFYKNLFLSNNQEYIIEEPSSKGCLQRKITDKLTFSKHKSSVVIFESSLYQISVESQVQRLEVYCRNDADLDEEIFIYYEGSEARYSIDSYLRDENKKIQSSSFNVARSKNAGILRFQNLSKQSNFQMFLANTGDNPKWQTADYEYMLDQKKLEKKFQCLLTNSLDPDSIRPKLTKKIHLLPLGEKVEVTLLNNLEDLPSNIELELNPLLPNGLELSEASVSISGLAREAQKISPYEISFKANGMFLKENFYLGVGKAISLSQNLDLCRIKSDEENYVCNLSSFIDSNRVEPGSLWLDIDLDEVYWEGLLQTEKDLDLYLFSSLLEPATIKVVNRERTFIDLQFSKLVLQNLSFEDYLPNTENGGLVNLNMSKLFVEDSIFSPANYKDNFDNYQGGSIKLKLTDTWIEKSVFKDDYNINEANVGKSGGAIYAESGSLDIKSSSFIGNRALEGGAIYVWAVKLLIQDSEFIGNHSNSRGGAIAARSSSLRIHRSSFSANRSIFDGGAINSTFSNELYILNSSFHNNTGMYGANIKVGSSGFFPYVLIQNSQFIYDGNLKSRSIFHTRKQYFLDQSFTNYHLLANTFYTAENAKLKQSICRLSNANDNQYITSLGGNFYNSKDCKFSEDLDKYNPEMEVNETPDEPYEFVSDPNYFSNSFCPKYDILGRLRSLDVGICRSGPLR